MYEQVGDKWRAYCKNMPGIYGEGNTLAEALTDLTYKLRIVLNAVMEGQNRLCSQLEDTLVTHRYNKGTE